QVHRPSEFVWLYSVVKDTICHAWRKGTRKLRDARLDVPLPEHSSFFLAPVDSAASPSKAVVRAERAAHVQEILPQLPDHYREALLMHVLDVLTFPEIGEFLGIS